jgi:hypothetical protein
MTVEFSIDSRVPGMQVEVIGGIPASSDKGL